MGAGSVSERKGAAAERVKELPTDDVNGIARGRVKENAGEGGFEDDDAGTSVEEKFDGYAGVGDETESEEWWGTEERDDLAMDECAAVAGSTLDRQDRAIGADDEGLGAEDEEAMEEVDVATILATMTAAKLIISCTLAHTHLENKITLDFTLASSVCYSLSKKISLSTQRS